MTGDLGAKRLGIMGAEKGIRVNDCTLMGGVFDECLSDDATFRIPAVRGLPVSPRRRALRRKPVPRMPHDGNPPVVLRLARLWQALAALRRRRGNAREAYEVKDSFQERLPARRAICRAGILKSRNIKKRRRQYDGTIGNQGKGRDGDRLCEGH